MRKIVQKQIMDMIPAIWDGVQYIQTVEPNRAAPVLADCLLAMETLHESLRSGLSEQRFLYYKQYYEQVLLAMKQLNNEETIENKISAIYNGLDKMLTDITNEVEVKWEILFLPYKASMWDSLESIWLAAKDDERCQAYVMPIPYCDRKPDGQVAEWHCEAELFPEYVPITNFKEYNIAKRKPDVIYIHNPYDGYNFVTSVHPDYYSDELKKHTNTLVYVPYFVTGGGLAKSFYELPSYCNVDKIIIQSEKLIPYYSKTLTKNKLVPLGSPKFDRIFYYEKNKSQIPDAWAKRIGNKKVVFYNTSLAGILEFKEKALKKMRYVFSCFAGRDDVVVLWRPHPLTKATLKSMLPDLFNEYTKIEEDFIRNEIGVFDITPDVTKSIAISDAYLGEISSSIVHLFGVTGKPIFATDMLVQRTASEEEKASLLFSNACIDGENLWMVVDEYNTLCKMNLLSGEISSVFKFEGILVKDSIYPSPLKVTNRLILAPFNAQEICEYNLDTQETKKTALREPLEWGNFRQSIVYKSYVFMIPDCYPAILRYDLRTGTCTYYKKCIKELLKYRTSNRMELLGTCCVRDSKILAPSLLSNHVLEFDMDSGSYKIYTLGSEKENYGTIIDDGHEYWLLPWTTKTIVRWNYVTGEVKEYKDYPDDFVCSSDVNGGTYMFTGAVYSNNAIWIFPCYANMILCLDVVTGQIKKVDLNLPYEENMRKSEFYMQQNNYFGCFKYDDQNVAALSSYDRSLLIIDTIEETYRLLPCRLSPDDVQKLSIPFKESFGQLGEDATYAAIEDDFSISIDAFLEYVIDNQHISQRQTDSYAQFVKNMDGTCGGKVHDYIMKHMGE